MIGKAGLDPHVPYGEAQPLELLDLEVRRELAQIDRENRAFHLAGQDILQPMPRAFITQDAQMVLRLIRWQEKRQALNVVPMGVRQQQRQVKRLSVKLGG